MRSVNNQFGQPVGLDIDWQPVKKPNINRILGTFCALELLSIEHHARTLFEALSFENDGSSWTYLPYGPFSSYQEFCTWLRETQSLTDTMLYVIVDIHTKQPIGIAGYMRITPEHGVIEVGHVHFSKLLQKTPAATEAMYLMMKYVFDDLHYRRYEWKCDALNKPSWQAAERLGFKYEGIFRQHATFKNRNRDTAWFSIVDSEWPKIKEKFQCWLASNNFDESGRQKKSLQDMLASS